mgnify:FL=1
MPVFDTVLWDWNGTLLDDAALCCELLNTMLARHGYAPVGSMEAYRQVFCFPIETYYRRAGFDFSRHPFAALADEYMRLYTPRSLGCPLQPDACAVLDALRAQGMRQVMLSASKRENLQQQVEHFGLRSRFDTLLGLSDIYAKSKTEVGLRWLRESGLEAAVLRLSAAGTPVLGVCGGYQMLGEQLCDPAGEESGTPCTLRGLGLLPTTTVFGTEKHLTQTAACVTTEPFAGVKLTGYEIHAGRTEVRGSAFCILADGTPEGCVQDGVFGTYLHGLFDTGELTEKLTAFLCKRKGIDPAGAELIPMEQYRQQQFDLLADGVRAALDMPAIYAAMGMQKGDNT